MYGGHEFVPEEELEHVNREYYKSIGLKNEKAHNLE